MADPTVQDALLRQAASCATVGNSQLYADLLRGLAADHLAGGITAQLLDDVSPQPVHDAVPLRYLASVHRLALAGRAPRLAAAYPSCGGRWDGQDLTQAFLGTVEEHRVEVAAGLRRNVQTNEVGRSVVLHAGMCWLADRWQLPLRTLEVGASAGLLSNWPFYGYDDGRRHRGDLDGPLQFDASWYAAPLPDLSDPIVVERLASDISPIDTSTSEGRLTMHSFLWPDQESRLGRLDAALQVAAEHPLTPDRADAAEWVAAVLGTARDEPVGTVVFHAIVWQYLPASTRDLLRHTLRRHGERASVDRPLAWLRMEPAALTHADLRVTVWPGGDDLHLADVGYHGADVRWFAA